MKKSKRGPIEIKLTPKQQKAWRKIFDESHKDYLRAERTLKQAQRRFFKSKLSKKKMY